MDYFDGRRPASSPSVWPLYRTPIGHPNYCLKVGLPIQANLYPFRRRASVHCRYRCNQFAMPNNNHPKRGSTIRVQPIRDLTTIRQIRDLLQPNPRDLCFFVLGINTAYRANELLSIKCGQVAHLRPGDLLDLRQTKTKKHRAATLNHSATNAIRHWLQQHLDPRPQTPLFLSRTGRSLTVPTASNMVKRWCRCVGLKGNYGSHTLRKTWGFHQLRQNQDTRPQMVLPILMQAYGHTSQEQTLEYLCIQSDEVANLFMQVEL